MRSSLSLGTGTLRLALTMAVAGVALLFVPAAQASHQFTDVPDGHQFHNEISAFKDTNITSGKTCTPPGTPPTFCPNEPVLRQSMAAFITRALGLVVRPGESELVAVPGSRIAMVDDGSSLVRTNAGALELSHGGLRALRLEGIGQSPNVIGGFSGNGVAENVSGAAIGGGGSAFAEGMNQVGDNFGTVAGGRDNVAGDMGPSVVAQFATVGGGEGNTASGPNSTIAGGDRNTASGQGSFVGGGVLNTASALYSMIPGGESNVASGFRSFAAGRFAQATHAGSFVWADGQNFPIGSAANDSFTARTTGGARFISGIDLVNGDPTAGVTLAAGGGSWSSLSDVSAKRDFRPVDGRAVLRALMSFPITTWSYRSQPDSIRHMGPTAQDFRRAFGLGEDARHITSVDADGVALAAVQALARENEALRRENRKQGERLAALERQVAALLKRK